MRRRVFGQINNAILAGRCGLAFFPVELNSTPSPSSAIRMLSSSLPEALLSGYTTAAATPDFSALETVSAFAERDRSTLKALRYELMLSPLVSATLRMPR